MIYNTLGLHDFREGERVIAIVRHHWFVLFREVFGLVILFILPFFLIPITFSIAVQGGNIPPVPGGVVIFFASLWTLIVWNLLFARWTNYYYDIWVITNWRILDVDQQGFFNRKVATLLTLDHIEDIETEVNGIINSLLNFGSIQVQTAAAHIEFHIDDIPNPTETERVIRSAQEEKIRVFGDNMSPRHDLIAGNSI
ncbi:MAG: hypothetical protein V4437_01670 [Patescibacteria group bacterium]